MHDGSSRDEGRRAGAVPRDVPIAATAVYGQSGSDARATECFVGVGTGTPDGANGNFRHISYSGSVFCPNGNAANRVTIHITEVTLRDTSDTRILAAAPQYGPYVIANDGGTTGGSYNRISDTQSQFIKIQAYLEITSGTTGSSNGWHAVPPQCTKLSRFKVRCDFNSGAFTFVPTEGPGDSTAVAGAGACGVGTPRSEQTVPGGGVAGNVPGGDLPSTEGVDDTVGRTLDAAPVEDPGTPSPDVCESDTQATAAYHRSFYCQLSGRVYSPSVAFTSTGSGVAGTAAPFCSYVTTQTALLRVCVDKRVFVGVPQVGWNQLTGSCRNKHYTSSQMFQMTQQSVRRRCTSGGKRFYRTTAWLSVRGPGGYGATRVSPTAELPCAA